MRGGYRPRQSSGHRSLRHTSCAQPHSSRSRILPLHLRHHLLLIGPPRQAHLPRTGRPSMRIVTGDGDMTGDILHHGIMTGAGAGLPAVAGIRQTTGVGSARTSHRHRGRRHGCRGNARASRHGQRGKNGRLSPRRLQPGRRLSLRPRRRWRGAPAAGAAGAGAGAGWRSPVQAAGAAAAAALP